MFLYLYAGNKFRVRNDFGEPNTVLNFGFSELSREEDSARQYFKAARVGRWQVADPYSFCLVISHELRLGCSTAHCFSPQSRDAYR